MKNEYLKESALELNRLPRWTLDDIALNRFGVNTEGCTKLEVIFMIIELTDREKKSR